jgi:rhodanese-related sulfurtransferase
VTGGVNRANIQEVRSGAKRPGSLERSSKPRDCDGPAVRVAWFGTGKIAGAANVSRGMLEFRADPESPYHDKAFAKDKTVILNCASGGRSALAGKALKDLGYAEVFNLGAFKDWAESGGAVDRPV